MRLCNHCNCEKKKTDFYRDQGRCKKCWNKMIIQRQKDLKQKALVYKGGCCSKCGYSKCYAALEFHHLDPTTKDFNISSTRSWSWVRLKPELDKCVLLCSNCHREEHSTQEWYAVQGSNL